jgi:hypothetical protein
MPDSHNAVDETCRRRASELDGFSRMAGTLRPFPRGVKTVDAAEPFDAPTHLSKGPRVLPSLALIFPALAGNGFAASGLVLNEIGRLKARNRRMAQQTQQWRSGNGEMAWLSTLVDTMKTLSHPELRAMPCDPALRMAVQAHLAGAATPHGLYGSNFSLRN